MAEYLAGLLLLAVTAAEDIREKKISVCIVTAFAIAAVIYRMASGEFYWQKVITDMLPGGMLVLISLLTGESIGYGDGVLVMTLGLWLGGIFTLTVTVTGIMISGIYGVICLLRRKYDPIPFVPFLLIGMEVALLYA